MNMKKTISVGSDFSGVGAFETALKRVTERKGMNVRSVFACDMDKHARKSFLANHDAPETFFENVYDRSIPEDSLDIYMTSPPCQSFSIAGLKKGKDDPRGILFFNSFEFIKTNNPRFAIFENVKGLVSDDEGRTFQEWVTLLGGKSINGAPVIFPYEDALPYHLYFSVLNAKDFDVPQTRERVFLVLIRDDEDNSFQFPKGRPFTRVLRDVLEDEVDEKYFLSEKHIQRCLKHPANEKLLEREIPEFCRTITSGYHKGGFSNPYLKINSATQKGYEEGRDGDSIDLSMPESKTRRGRIGKGYAHALRTNGQQGVIQLNPSKESGGKQPYQQNRIYDVEGLSPALNNSLSTGGNLINDFRIRRLTPRECFRLMDFDDDFKFVVSDTQLYRQAGNSIVCRVLEDIIDKLKL